MRLLLLALIFVFASCIPKQVELTEGQIRQIRYGLQDGSITLTCHDECYHEFSKNSGEMQILYAKEAWQQLAETVVAARHDNELAYYYLGRSAEEMGYTSGAAKYYKFSMLMAKEGTSQQRCAVLLACPFAASAQAQQRLQAMEGGKPSAAGPQPKPAPQRKGAASKGAKGPSPLPGGITKGAMLNLSFFDSEYAEQQVVFKNGKWSKPETPGRKSRNGLAEDSMEWEITDTTVGDLNGDGLNDGAFLAQNHVGMSNGVEVFVFAVLAKPEGGYTVTKPLLVGDKHFSRSSFAIAKQGVQLTSRVSHGLQERGEAPKGRRVQIFQVRDNALVDPKASKPAQQLPVAKGDENGGGAKDSRSLTRNAIKNISFKEKTIASGTLSVDFRDGRWSKDVKVSLRDSKPWSYKDIRTITDIALGDLNNDRVVDAVFVTIHQSGEEGDYATLRAVWHDGKGFRVSESLMLGSGVRIASISIAGGKIQIAMLVPMDWADATSEQFRVAQSFMLKAGALVLSPGRR